MNLIHSLSGAPPTLTCPQPATQPSLGQFVTLACKESCSDSSPQQRTTVKSCTVPSGGDYVTSACVSGDSNTVGSNTVVGSCTVPSDGDYVTSACVSGDSNTVGTDTGIDTDNVTKCPTCSERKVRTTTSVGCGCSCSMYHIGDNCEVRTNVTYTTY